MIQLIIKEVRQLQPILYLWFALLASAVVATFLPGRIDEMTFGAWCQDCGFEPNTASAVITSILLMVLAYSLFPREHDESTIDFLRALPVSRKSIFVAKVLAAWFSIIVLFVFFYSVHALLLSANPESIGGRFYSQFWFTLLWRDCLFAFVVLSHGVFLSWFRTLGLILYFVYLIGLLIAESYYGSSGYWSIFTLMNNDFRGSELVVNSTAIIIHAGVALVLFFVSYWLWNRTESGGTENKKESRSFRFVQMAFTTLGFLSIALLMAYQIQKGTGEGEANTLGVTGTDHYRFAYNKSDQTQVDFLLEHAESDLSSLAQLLGIDTLPQIRVDLSSESEHAAGLAKWKNILVDLQAFDNEVTNRRVLAHETVHVFQGIESNRALRDNHNAAKFFIEGMAQYLSFEVVEESERRRKNWTLAAVAWSRQRIEFSDLIDASGFARRFDAELHYSLGDLWVKAMVETCGLPSLGNFLRAVGREDAPMSLRADYFWRDTMQAIDCELDAVNSHWRASMEQLYADTNIALFPEFADVSIVPGSTGSFVKIVASLKPADESSFHIASELKKPASSQKDHDVSTEEALVVPKRFLVRVGNVSVTLASKFDPSYRGTVEQVNGDVKVEFSVPRRAISGNRFRYQLGYIYTDGARYLFDSWRNGSLSR